MLASSLAKFRVFPVIFTGALLSLATSNVLALGLGEIKLNSNLNEPLDATIELLQLDGLDETQLRISMGSQEDFDRVDIEKLPLLNLIELDVQVQSDNEGVLHLTTTTPINEPYLSFILNARWPSGRLIREYTMLLDLPSFTESSETVVVVREAEASPVIRRTTPRPTQSGRAFNESGDEQTVVIQPNDTLWEIALEARPNNSVSVQQMMLAIQRANQNAFINNNINRIKTGQVLRIPELQEIQSLSQQQAEAQVAIQNQRVDIAAEPLATSASNGSGTRSPARDELRVLTGADASTTASAGDDLESVILNLQNELALSDESLDRARVENQELTSRLVDLETEIEMLQNIIVIEDERIAQLQRELAEQSEAASQALAAATAASEELKAVEQQVIEPPVDNSMLGKLNALFKNTLAVIGTVVLILLLMVGFLVWRRRQAAYDEDEFNFDEESNVAKKENNSLASSFDTAEEEIEPEESSALDEALGLADSSEETDSTELESDSEPEDITETERVEPFVDIDEPEPVEEVESDEFDEDELAELVNSEFAEVDGDLEAEDIGFFAKLKNRFFGNKEEEELDQISLSEQDFEANVVETGTLDEELESESNETAAESVVEDEDDEDDLSEEEMAFFKDPYEDGAQETEEVPEVNSEEADLNIDLEADIETEPAEIEPVQVESIEEEDEVLSFVLEDVVESEPESLVEEKPEEVESFEFSVASDTNLEESEAPSLASSEDEVEVLDFASESENEVKEEYSLSDIDDEDDEFLDFGNLDIDEAILTAADENEAGDEDNLISDQDENTTKLDLAVAYEVMGDLEGAREILLEVIESGTETQVAEANRLMKEWENS